MSNRNFSFIGPGKLIFGEGTVKKLPSIIKSYAGPALLLTGASSFQKSEHYSFLVEELNEAGIEHYHESVKGEPEAPFIDDLKAKYAGKEIAVVLSIGGGSVIDSGKAISAMLTVEGSIEDYLEGIGTETHRGTKVPFIALPTTAGTGSEVTKNAVISKVGPGGYKKSLRHDNFVPDLALIDPALQLNCPFAVTVACAMDALTQLLEAYVSTKSSLLTDCLAKEGLFAITRAFSKMLKDESSLSDLEVRSDLAYAAYLSGITLANAGLGTVHGFASSVGGLYHIPHGALCGTLLAPSIKAAVQNLSRDIPDLVLLKKYADAGAILTGTLNRDTREGYDKLLEMLNSYSESFKMPRLSEYGVKKEDIAKIAEMTGNKNSPAPLTKGELEAILLERL